MTDWWGYISIDADTIPECLSNRTPLFLNRAWVRWKDRRGFWIPWEEEPSRAVVAAFQEAKESFEIDDYHIVHPKPIQQAGTTCP